MHNESIHTYRSTRRLVKVDVDSLVQAAAKEALSGHQYLNIVIKGKAQTGDAFSSDWKGETIGASHRYDGVGG